MDFKILDANAFYAGIPFRTQEKFYTTFQVFNEIKHIKKEHGALQVLIDTDRLVIKEPEKKNIQKVTEIAKQTGDFNHLSNEDISIIALAFEMKGQIITDDFAVSNVSKQIGLQVDSVMTTGIKKVGKWISYCPACKKRFSNQKECPLCGNILRRNLEKNN